MSIFRPVSGLSPVRSFLPLALIALVFIATGAPAQTAPQLLPYTAKLIAGSAPTATMPAATSNPAAGGACPISGYTALDTHGDGCLGTEILLGTSSTAPGPRDAVADSAGNVFFSDYVNATIRRVDLQTGIVTIVAGGGGTSAGTATSGTLGTATKLVHPAALVINPSNGDLYFSDPGNGQVFKIAATGGFVGGSVGSVAITSGGTGYSTTTPPTVTFSAPASGTTATGTATVSAGGVVTGVTITNAGSGYTSTPTVTFSAPTSGTTATGFVGTTGAITLVAGNPAGTPGYAASNAIATITEGAGNSYLRQIYGLAMDSKGDLFMADEYYYTIVVLNTSSTTNTINNTTVPAGQIVKVVGSLSAPTSSTSTTYCTNGTASSSGCAAGIYNFSSYFAAGVQANGDEVHSPYAVGVDPNGNLYSPDEYYDATFMVSPAGVLTNFAGTPNTAAKVIMRAKAGSFSIGSGFGIAVDSNSNVYIGDASAGAIWRVDNAGLSQYIVAGGVGDTGGATAVCSGATDTLGDGCIGTQASIGHSGSGNYATTTLPGPGIYGVSVDSNANLYFADTENNDVREIASGTQFGVIGANQPTQTLEIHFASGDMSSSTMPPMLTSGNNNFSLGTLTCNATNSDGTTDCLLPVKATPTVLGPFSGTLKVTGQVGGSASFALSGIYAQSPNTRTSLSYSANSSCTGTTTYSTVTSVTLTAILTANGPAPPVSNISTDYITFYANNGITNTAIGTVAVSNLGTMSSPIYGATLPPYTFSTPGTYTLTAVYSGDSYFKSSTGTSPTTITTSLPSFSLTSTGYSGPSLLGVPTVTPGETEIYSFTVNQVVYAGTITFAVTGLPPNSSYSISPVAGFTAVGCSTTNTVVLSILTQAGTKVTPAGFGAGGHGPWQMLCVLAGLGLALLIGLRRRRIPMRYGQFWMALALLIAASGAVACGKSVGTVLQPATPAGNYTIVVTPSTTVGTAPAPIMFSLTVN